MEIFTRTTRNLYLYSYNLRFSIYIAARTAYSRHREELRVIHVCVRNVQINFLPLREWQGINLYKVSTNDACPMTL